MLKTLLTSKKFIAAIVGVAVGLIAKLGIQLDTDAVALVISPILAYIVGQGVADHGKSRAQEIVKALSDDDSEDLAAEAANEELSI